MSNIFVTEVARTAYSTEEYSAEKIFEIMAENFPTLLIHSRSWTNTNKDKPQGIINKMKVSQALLQVHSNT